MYVLWLNVSKFQSPQFQWVWLNKNLKKNHISNHKYGNGNQGSKKGYCNMETAQNHPDKIQNQHLPGDYFTPPTTARLLGMWTIRCPVIFHNQICHMMDAPARFWILVYNTDDTMMASQTAPWIIIDFSVILSYSGFFLERLKISFGKFFFFFSNLI